MCTDFKCLFFKVLKCCLIHALMYISECLFNGCFKLVKLNYSLFTAVTEDKYALTVFDILRTYLYSYRYAEHLILAELPAGCFIAVIKLYTQIFIKQTIFKLVCLFKNAFLFLSYRYNSNLYRCDFRRQYKTVIIAVYHDYSAYHSC